MDCDIEMNSKDYTVFYAFHGERHQDIIQLNYSPDMSIESVIESNCEKIKDFIVEKLQPFYDDAMSQGSASMNPDGIYIYDEIYDDTTTTITSTMITPQEPGEMSTAASPRLTPMPTITTTFCMKTRLLHARPSGRLLI